MLRVSPPDPDSTDLFERRRWKVECFDGDVRESVWYEPTFREALLKVHHRQEQYEIVDGQGKSLEFGPELTVEKAKALLADEAKVAYRGRSFDPKNYEFRVGTERKPVTPGAHGNRMERLWHADLKCAEATIKEQGHLVWGPDRTALDVSICETEFWPCKCVKE